MKNSAIKFPTVNGVVTYPFHYPRWKNMIRRCKNPKDLAYPRYGGRGISVCKEWENFERFNSWCLKTFQPGKTLDRINNDGNYCPSNCRWATLSEQQKNSRQTKARRSWQEKLGKLGAKYFHGKFGDPQKRTKQRCSSCKRILLKDKFYSAKTRSGGISNRCKKCSDAYGREWRLRRASQQAPV